MQNPFRYFKSSPEVIRLAVMLYIRYPLSLRQVEDLLFERGIDICHETVRFWWNRFGPMFAAEIRKRRVQRRSYSNWRWHLDEVFVRINGKTHYLWRAVDHEGEVLEVIATKRRDRKAALKFIKRAMKRYGRPTQIAKDRLRSYGAAMKVIGNTERQECARWLNNRAENSHQPFRRREGAMARFRDIKTLQKFASVHASIHNHSHGEWLVKERINSLCAWYSSAVMGSKSEPLSATRPFAEPVKLTSGRRSHRLHQHPAFGGGGSGGRGHSSTRLFQPNGCPVRPPESGEADQAPRNRIRDIANY